MRRLGRMLRIGLGGVRTWADEEGGGQPCANSSVTELISAGERKTVRSQPLTLALAHARTHERIHTHTPAVSICITHSRADILMAPRFAR